MNTAQYTDIFCAWLDQHEYDAQLDLVTNFDVTITMLDMVAAIDASNIEHFDAI
jgi:hypothetical protein